MTPSVVSTKTIPHVNISGKIRIVQIGTVDDTPTPTLIDQGDLGRSIESEPEKDADREDVPRFPDDSEERAEQAVQDAPLVQELLQFGRVELLIPFLQFDKHAVDAHDDQDVDQANDDQERAGDREPDDRARALDRRELGDDHPRRDDQRDGQDEDDRRVAEGKPRAHRERTLPVLEQFPRRVVDGHDMIRIHPVTQAERVGDEPETCEDGGDLADDEGQNETDRRGAEDQRIQYPDSDPLAPRNAEPGSGGVVRGGGSGMTHVSEVTLVPH